MYKYIATPFILFSFILSCMDSEEYVAPSAQSRIHKNSCSEISTYQIGLSPQDLSSFFFNHPFVIAKKILITRDKHGHVPCLITISRDTEMLLRQDSRIQSIEPSEVNL